MKTLVAGWFSFNEMGATAGDLMTRDLVATWLERNGVDVDVAVAPPFEGGVDWRTANAVEYDTVVFVCGPFGNGPPLTEFMPRFAHCRFVGVNLSMLQPLEEWNPFALLLERDSSRTARPDLAFLAPSGRVPVVGVLQVHPQDEYGDRAMHLVANDAIAEVLELSQVAPIHIDTRLDVNRSGYAAPEQVESVISRVDAVITTRLHGMVLAIKNGVPALAIDPIAGGAKVSRQARTIGWPIAYAADDLQVEALVEALEYCLTVEARTLASECRSRAADALAPVADQLLAFFAEDD